MNVLKNLLTIILLEYDVSRTDKFLTISVESGIIILFGLSREYGIWPLDLFM